MLNATIKFISPFQSTSWALLAILAITSFHSINPLNAEANPAEKKREIPKMVKDSSKYPTLSSKKEYRMAFKFLKKAIDGIKKANEVNDKKKTLKKCSNMLKKAQANLTTLLEAEGYNEAEKAHLEKLRQFTQSQVYWVKKLMPL